MELASPQRADNDWGVLLEKFCSILGSRPHEQVPALLLAIRRQFRWPMVEYWVNRGDGYRIICESHEGSDALDRLERESSTFVIPPEWVKPDEWRLDPTVPYATSRGVFWSTDHTLKESSIRAGMLAEAGIKTQVALVVPNRGERQHIIMLFDTLPRRATFQEVNALAVALFLLGGVGGIQIDVSPIASVRPHGRTRLDPDSRTLVGPEASLRLTVREWDLLSALFEREGRVVAFDEIAQGVWGAPAQLVGRDVMYEVVARVRRHLSAVGNEYSLDNIAGHGYKLQRSR